MMIMMVRIINACITRTLFPDNMCKLEFKIVSFNAYKICRVCTWNKIYTYICARYDCAVSWLWTDMSYFNCQNLKLGCTNTKHRDIFMTISHCFYKCQLICSHEPTRAATHNTPTNLHYREHALPLPTGPSSWPHRQSGTAYHHPSETADPSLYFRRRLKTHLFKSCWSLKFNTGRRLWITFSEFWRWITAP